MPSKGKTKAQNLKLFSIMYCFCVGGEFIRLGKWEFLSLQGPIYWSVVISVLRLFPLLSQGQAY